jgi:hypothetical protein
MALFQIAAVLALEFVGVLQESSSPPSKMGDYYPPLGGRPIEVPTEAPRPTQADSTKGKAVKSATPLPASRMGDYFPPLGGLPIEVPVGVPLKGAESPTVKSSQKSSSRMGVYHPPLGGRPREVPTLRNDVFPNPANDHYISARTEPLGFLIRDPVLLTQIVRGSFDVRITSVVREHWYGYSTPADLQSLRSVAATARRLAQVPLQRRAVDEEAFSISMFTPEKATIFIRQRFDVTVTWVHQSGTSVSGYGPRIEVEAMRKAKLSDASTSAENPALKTDSPQSVLPERR